MLRASRISVEVCLKQIYMLSGYSQSEKTVLFELNFALSL